MKNALSPSSDGVEWSNAAQIYQRESIGIDSDGFKIVGTSLEL